MPYHRNPIINEAIGAVMNPESMEYINHMSERLGYSSKTVTNENLHELMNPARMAFISIHLAKCFFETGEYKQSLLWLKVALECDHPDKEIIEHNMKVAKTHIELSNGLNDRMGEDFYIGNIIPEEKDRIVDEVIFSSKAGEHSETITSLYYKLGQLHGELRNWDEAIICFDKGRRSSLSEYFPDGECHGTLLNDSYSCSGACSTSNDSGIFE